MSENQTNTDEEIVKTLDAINSKLSRLENTVVELKTSHMTTKKRHEEKLVNLSNHVKSFLKLVVSFQENTSTLGNIVLELQDQISKIDISELDEIKETMRDLKESVENQELIMQEYVDDKISDVNDSLHLLKNHGMGRLE